MPNITNITPPRVSLVDERTGAVSREWYRFFYNLFYATGGENNGATPVERGGTGTTVVPTDGQLLIGNSTTQAYTVADLGTGAGIGKTVGSGTLEIENTGVLSIIAGNGIGVDQATGDVTIENTGVLSIIAGPGIAIDQSTGDVTISATSAPDQESQTATAGQTVFTLTTMTYVPGSNSLSVFIDGVNQILNEAFTETNSTTVTFSSGLHVGAKVRFATS